MNLVERWVGIVWAVQIKLNTLANLLFDFPVTNYCVTLWRNIVEIGITLILSQCLYFSVLRVQGHISHLFIPLIVILSRRHQNFSILRKVSNILWIVSVRMLFVLQRILNCSLVVKKIVLRFLCWRELLVRILIR